MRTKYIIIFMVMTAIIGGLYISKNKNDGPQTASVIERLSKTRKTDFQTPDKTCSKSNRKALLLKMSPSTFKEMTYSFELFSEGKIDAAAISPQFQPQSNPELWKEIKLHSFGRLHLKFYELRSGLWQAAGRLTNIEYQVDNRDAAWKWALATPFLFHLQENGVMLKFRFPEGVPQQASDFIKTILAGLQVEFPRMPENSWETIESNPTGRFKALYNLDDTSEDYVRLKKVKSIYLSNQAGKASLLPALSDNILTVEKSLGLISFSNEHGLPVASEISETITGASRGRRWSRVESMISITLLHDAETCGLPASLTSAEQLLETREYIEAEFYQTDPQLNPLTKDDKIDGVLALFQEMTSASKEGGRQMADKMIVNYLRQYPMAAFQLPAILNQRDNGLSMADKRTLWRLLAKTGHMEAQQALVEAAANPEYSTFSRMQALVNINDIQAPQEFVIDALWRMIDLYAQSVNVSEINLKNTAILALGTASGREDFPTDAREQAANDLSDRLASSDNKTEKLIYLNAMGNHGGSVLVPEIQTYLRHPDPEIRARAYSAFRRMKSEEAFQALCEGYEMESDNEVRLAAVSALTSMPLNGKHMAWVREKVTKADNSNLSAEWVEVLGRNLKKYPQNKQVLRELANKNNPIEIRKKVYGFIAPN